MYSMKRTSAPKRRPNSSRSISSSSLTPRMTTVSILKPGNSGAAVSMPSRTRSSSSYRVRSRKRCGLSVSRLTVRRWSPASRTACALVANSTPLVVIARSWMAGRAARRWIRSGRLRRSSGSPPVRRTLSTPRLVNRSTSVSISSKWRMSSLGSHT